MPTFLSQNAQVNPNVSVDCVIFGFDGKSLNVLLIERKSAPSDDEIPSDSLLALPGNLVMDDESLDVAASRVLFELTGLSNIYLEQFYAFGNPDRVKTDIEWLRKFRKNPEARVITIAYFSLIKQPTGALAGNKSSFAHRTVWIPVNDLPHLAFDHNSIVRKAQEVLREKMRFHPIGFELLPKKFTLSQLQKLHEIIFGKTLDKRNFRRRMLNFGFLIPQEEKQENVSHKPATLYKFSKSNYDKYFKEENFDFK